MSYIKKIYITIIIYKKKLVVCVNYTSNQNTLVYFLTNWKDSFSFTSNLF